MKTRLLLLALLALGFVSTAARAQDQLVLRALAVIEKYEALEPGLASGDVETANSYINGLGKGAKYLNAAYKKDTEH